MGYGCRMDEFQEKMKKLVKNYGFGGGLWVIFGCQELGLCLWLWFVIRKQDKNP